MIAVDLDERAVADKTATGQYFGLVDAERTIKRYFLVKQLDEEQPHGSSQDQKFTYTSYRFYRFYTGMAIALRCWDT